MSTLRVLPADVGHVPGLKIDHESKQGYIMNQQSSTQGDSKVEPGSTSPDSIAWDASLEHEADGAAPDGAAPGGLISRPPKLFISYRRYDTTEFVEALDRRLRQDLGSENVFRDVHELIAGERFELRLRDEIEQSDVVLVVIGPNWEGAADDGTGPSRLADADDFVRKEVRIALANRPRLTPMPLLVDGATFPTDLPADIDAIKEHEAIKLTCDELTREDSPGYQALLVGMWDAKRRSVPNGVLMFTGDSPKAKAQLDALVEDMKARNLIDVSQITRYACGAQVLSMRKARHLARKYPNIIILVDNESADSRVLANRTDALSRLSVGKVATVTIGGAITYGAGVATGTGALGNLSSQLGGALVKLGGPKSVTNAAKLWTWQATTPIAVKVAAGAIAAGAAAGGGAGLAALIEPAPHELAGTWAINDWQVVDESIEPDTALVNNRANEQWTITADPEDCHGDQCELDVERQYGGQPVVGLTLEPTDEGWVAVTNTNWTCEGSGEVASEGRVVYTVRQDPDTDTLRVTYAYEGTPTVPAPADCSDGLARIVFTGTAAPEGE